MVKYLAIVVFLLVELPVFATKTTFILIRHGQTDWNVQGKWQGQADIPLNSKGIAEAKMVANKLYEEHADISAIYSSDLIRAIDTAKETQSKFQLPLQILPALREYKIGEAEGLTAEEVVFRFGGWGLLQQQYPDKKERWKHSQIPGQETIDETFNRLKESICLISESHPDQKVALFTHGGCIKILVANLLDLESIEEVATPNGCFYELVYESKSHLFLKNF